MTFPGHKEPGEPGAFPVSWQADGTAASARIENTTNNMFIKERTTLVTAEVNNSPMYL